MIQVEVKNIDKVQAALAKFGLVTMRSSLRRAARRVGRIVKDASVPRTPISPTKAQYEASLKSKKSRRTDFHPGNLRKSIQVMKATERLVQVGVPSNSLGGEYADFIHNGTYELGPGSKAAFGSGQPVGNKFLERAVKAEERRIMRAVQIELDKAITNFNRGP